MTQGPKDSLTRTLEFVQASIKSTHESLHLLEQSNLPGTAAVDAARKLLRNLLEQEKKLIELIQQLPRHQAAGAEQPSVPDPRQLTLPKIV